MLNMLARAGGWSNFQHFRATVEGAVEEVAEGAPQTPPPVVDENRVKRLARQFDERGRLRQWPSRHSDRLACLWVLWSRFPSDAPLDEGEVNRRLGAVHLFSDPALLRRALCDNGLVRRTPDGREYRRVEQAPPPEELALIRRVGRAPFTETRSPEATR